RFCRVATRRDAVGMAHLLVLDVRRVADDDGKGALPHDPVKLREPVKRLVSFAPVREISRFSWVDAACSGPVTVQFFGPPVAPPAEFLPASDERVSVHALLGSPLTQPPQSSLNNFRFLGDVTERLFRLPAARPTLARHFPCRCPAYLLQRNEPHQCVTHADVQ